jgi:DNA-binding MarR family transcriptional regulator
MAEFSFKEKTPLNLINEISKIFEDIISKHPEMKELSEKTSRLILMQLSSSDGLTQSQLVKATHMKGSTVSLAINKMEEKGYVVRESNPYDMRSVRVYITRRGMELSEKVREIISKIEESVLKDFTKKDENNLTSLLELVLSNIKKV